MSMRQFKNNLYFIEFYLSLLDILNYHERSYIAFTKQVFNNNVYRIYKRQNHCSISVTSGYKK